MFQQSKVLFCDHISMLLGMMGLADGAGEMIDPSIGGFAYIIGGLKLPFIMIIVSVWIVLMVQDSLITII